MAACWWWGLDLSVVRVVREQPGKLLFKTNYCRHMDVWSCINIGRRVRKGASCTCATCRPHHPSSHVYPVAGPSRQRRRQICWSCWCTFLPSIIIISPTLLMKVPRNTMSTLWAMTCLVMRNGEHEDGVNTWRGRCKQLEYRCYFCLYFVWYVSNSILRSRVSEKRAHLL